MIKDYKVNNVFYTALDPSNWVAADSITGGECRENTLVDSIKLLNDVVRHGVDWNAKMKDLMMGLQELKEKFKESYFYD